MPGIFRTCFATLLLFLLAGCAAGAKAPGYRASGGFKPAGLVEQSCPQAFDLVNRVLDNENIPSLQSNREQLSIESCIVRGDSLGTMREGPVSDDADGSFSYRIKNISDDFWYTIRLAPVGADKCRVDISVAFSPDTDEYLKANYKYRQNKKDRELWLYEKIEKQ